MLPAGMSSFRDSLPIIPITNTAIVQLDTMESPVRLKASYVDLIVASMEVPVWKKPLQMKQNTIVIAPKMTMLTNLMLVNFVNTRVLNTVTIQQQKMDNCFVSTMELAKMVARTWVAIAPQDFMGQFVSSTKQNPHLSAI